MLFSLALLRTATLWDSQLFLGSNMLTRSFLCRLRGTTDLSLIGAEAILSSSTEIPPACACCHNSALIVGTVPVLLEKSSAHFRWPTTCTHAHILRSVQLFLPSVTQAASLIKRYSKALYNIHSHRPPPIYCLPLRKFCRLHIVRASPASLGAGCSAAIGILIFNCLWFLQKHKFNVEDKQRGMFTEHIGY